MPNLVNAFNQSVHYVKQNVPFEDIKNYVTKKAQDAYHVTTVALKEIPQVTVDAFGATKKYAIESVKYIKSTFELEEVQVEGSSKKGKKTKEENLSPQEKHFKEISTLNKPCWAEDVPEKKNSQGDPSAFLKIYTSSLMKFSEQSEKATAFSILGKNNAIRTFSTQDANIIEQSTWKDLSFYAGSGKDVQSSLVNKINRTSTEMGKAYLSGLLSSPTTDVQILKNRQQITKRFTTDEYKPIAKALENMQEGEKHLLKFWDPKLMLPNCLVGIDYIYNDKIDKVLNHNAAALDASFFVDHVSKIAQVITLVALPIILPFTALASLGVITLPTALSGFASRFIGTSSIFHSLAYLVPSKITQAITAVAVAAISLIRLPTMEKWRKAHFKMDIVTQNKIFHVATYYRNMKKIYETLSKIPESQNLDHFKKLEEFFKDESMKPLLSLLESGTFDSKADDSLTGTLFRRGNVLLAWKLLREQSTQDKFGKALTAMGEIDTYMSAAKLTQEPQGTNGALYRFPKYIENSERPSIHAKNIWNPFIDQKTVVTSSIDLGEGAPSRNGILKGKTGGGKTILISALTESLIIAQTLGISCGDLTFTPFHDIDSSMYVHGAQGEESHLQSEVDRVNKIIARLKALKQGQFGFTVLDELYTGAPPADATALASAVAKVLGETKNTINMIVTHDKELTKLETPAQNDENKVFMNYRIKVDGEGHSLFEIEPGIPADYSAIDEAANRNTDSRITDAARAIKQKGSDSNSDTGAGVGK